MPGIYDKWDTRFVEDIDVSQSDFQTMLDELTDAQRTVWCNTVDTSRHWVFGLIPRVPGHMLEENSDLPSLDPEGRFRKIAEIWRTGWDQLGSLELEEMSGYLIVRQLSSVQRNSCVWHHPQCENCERC